MRSDVLCDKALSGRSMSDRRRIVGELKLKGLRKNDSCPRCSSGLVIAATKSELGPIDLCVACLAMWEREERKYPELDPCGACAFRPGSTEQADPARWREIVDETVRSPGEFFCHKRVPFVITGDGIAYQHAKDERGRPTQTPRCAGWAKARATVLLAECRAEHAGVERCRSVAVGEVEAARTANASSTQGGVA